MTGNLRKLIEGLAAATSEGREGSCWYPSADIYRTDRGWLVKFDLAGVRPGEIRLTRSGRRLAIEGSRRDALVQQGLCSYSLEISYNRFERAVELPVEIESLELNTDYRDGMLLVWLNEQQGRGT